MIKPKFAVPARCAVHAGLSTAPGCRDTRLELKFPRLRGRPWACGGKRLDGLPPVLHGRPKAERAVAPARVVPAFDDDDDRHARLSAWTSRSTRSSAGRSRSSRTVVFTLRRRRTPGRLASRIGRSTRLRPTRMPAAARSAWIRGAPQVPSDAPWTARIRSNDPASSRARSEGARSRLAQKPPRDAPSAEALAARRKSARFAVMSSTTSPTSHRSERTRPRPLPGCRAPARAASPRGEAGAAPRARRHQGQRAARLSPHRRRAPRP